MYLSVYMNVLGSINDQKNVEIKKNMWGGYFSTLFINEKWTKSWKGFGKIKNRWVHGDPRYLHSKK